MNKLSLKPPDNHPPKTELKVIEDRTFHCYKKLKNFLARTKDSFTPMFGWGDIKKPERHLFLLNGWHCPVKWKPKIDEQWQRLTYQEFCTWYGIED